MRIATLQFSPKLGAVDQNIQRANAILAASPAQDWNLIVLPEMAFSGYNFADATAIKPYLESTASGPSARWAIETALRLRCHVVVGYPEIYTIPEDGSTQNYNAVVVVSPSGEVVANYRKSFLYYTDETWACEGHHHPETAKSAAAPFFAGQIAHLGGPASSQVGLGICMDINPYKFEAPWTDYEFATRMLRARCRLVILSMAWLSRLLPAELYIDADKPDMETVVYWLQRFQPFLSPATTPDEEVIVVFANRCGVEGNRVASTDGVASTDQTDESAEASNLVGYAGSSCVMRFCKGAVRMYDRSQGQVAIMGKGEEGVLVVDTDVEAKFLLQHRMA